MSIDYFTSIQLHDLGLFRCALDLAQSFASCPGGVTRRTLVRNSGDLSPKETSQSSDSMARVGTSTYRHQLGNQVLPRIDNNQQSRYLRDIQQENPT